MKNESFVLQILKLLRPLRYFFDSFTFNKNKNRAHKESLKALKNLYENKPLLIVGNGPSLNNTPLHEFSHIPSIGMNKINLIFNKTRWRPTYIVSSQPFVVSQNKDFWQSTSIKTFLSWKNRWQLNQDTKNNVNFYLQLNTDAFQKDISKGIGAGSTITFCAMQFAYYMGANPVILVGVDHNFSTAPNEKRGGIARAIGQDINHFDSSYFSDGKLWQIPDLERSEIGYLKARKAFEDDNRNIYDATVSGKLEIFKKITIDEAKELIAEH